MEKKDANCSLYDFLLFSTGYHFSPEEVEFIAKKVKSKALEMVELKDKATSLELDQYYSDLKESQESVK